MADRLISPVSILKTNVTSLELAVQRGVAVSTTFTYWLLSPQIWKRNRAQVLPILLSGSSLPLTGFLPSLSPPLSAPFPFPFFSKLSFSMLNPPFLPNVDCLVKNKGGVLIYILNKTSSYFSYFSLGAKCAHQRPVPLGTVLR